MNNINFLTLNVRGINGSKKRRAIFRQLHNKKVSKVFLQETYSSNDQEKIWSNEWGGKIYFNHGSKHSRGVAILFNPKLHVTIDNEIKSKDGRTLILEIYIEDIKYICVNIYAPNDSCAQIAFFKTLKDTLQQYIHVGEHIIIGGDFNCPLTSNDKEGGRENSSKKAVVSEIMNLADTL